LMSSSLHTKSAASMRGVSGSWTVRIAMCRIRSIAQAPLRPTDDHLGPHRQKVTFRYCLGLTAISFEAIAGSWFVPRECRGCRGLPWS
jgi:hypothetical protein